VIQAHNPEQEEAEDQVDVTYQGEEVEIGFNVNYLLDALGAIESDKVEIGLTDSCVPIAGLLYDYTRTGQHDSLGLVTQDSSLAHPIGV